jgi:hypothetical protein
MADQFKLHHQQSTGPWINQPRVQSVTLPIEPNVSAILIPDKLLVLPSLTTSGQILSEAEGDLHDEKKWTLVSLPLSFDSIYLPNQTSARYQLRLTPSTYRMTVRK